MKGTLAVLAVAAMMIAGDAAYTYSKLGNFYYYTEPMETAMQRVHYSTASTARSNDQGMPEAYQKYVACVARTFFFQACTLCFCTDVPNVALCWDYQEDRCAEIRPLVEQQLHAHNNDPNGVW